MEGNSTRSNRVIINKLINQQFLSQQKKKINIQEYAKIQKIPTSSLIDFFKYFSPHYKSLNARIPIILIEWIQEEKIFDETKKKREIERIIIKENSDNFEAIKIKNYYSRYSNYLFIKFNYINKTKTKKEQEIMLGILLNRKFQNYLKENNLI